MVNGADTDEDAEDLNEHVLLPLTQLNPKKRGRPLGSKNMTKTETPSKSLKKNK